MSKIYDINGNNILSAKVEEYFNAEVIDTVTKIKALQTEPCLVFMLCTDIHYDSHDTTLFPKTIENMKAVAEKVRTDGVFCLGDMTDGDGTQEVTKARLDAIMPLLMNMGLPVYFTAGNHDCNGYLAASNYFTTSQAYQQYYAPCDNKVFADDTSHGVNFYKDFDEYKIRLISLDATNTDSGNTPHYKYPENTVTWFSNVLPTTPNGYIVLLITHLSPTASHNWNSTVPSNASSVRSAISSWLETEGNTIVSLIGHSHSDFSHSDPYLEIACNCNKIEQDHDWEEDGTGLFPVGAKFWKRTEGTATEDCWDAVVVRPKTRKVNLIRFGAGEDREFSY